MDENQVLDDVAPIETDMSQEKLLPQSQVNKIVQREKEQAAIKARREAEEEYQRKLEAINATSQQQGQRNETTSREADADAIYQQVQEKFNQELQQQKMQDHMSNIANSYLSKVQQGRTAYEDFDDVTKRFDPTKFPQLTYLLAGIENAGHIIYEIAKNPTKLVTLVNLAKEDPEYAHDELLKMSASISTNQQAQSEAESQNTPAPLDRLQASRVSGSNGKPNIRDLRAQPWLRG